MLTAAAWQCLQTGMHGAETSPLALAAAGGPLYLRSLRLSLFDSNLVDAEQALLMLTAEQTGELQLLSTNHRCQWGGAQLPGHACPAALTSLHTPPSKCLTSASSLPIIVCRQCGEAPAGACTPAGKAAGAHALLLCGQAPQQLLLPRPPAALLPWRARG